MSEFPPATNLSEVDGVIGFRLDGVAADDLSGRSVASAGDVNGDGFDDLIIGAFGADPNGSNSGSSYIVFGKASGFASTIDLSTLDGSNGFHFDGGGRSGWSVSSAGDINGDGFDDVMIGAPGAGHFIASEDSSPPGVTYVVYGRAASFPSCISFAELDGSNGFAIEGVTNDASGHTVGAAGDVNGDGLPDLLVGASGASYVIFGQAASFASRVSLSDVNGANGFRLDGSGWVNTAGDINGDDFADLIIGGPSADPNGTNSGSSYIVFGKAGAFDPSLDLSTLDGTSGFRLDGAAAFDSFGRSVSSAGDVNGDGFDDVIIGAPYADPHGERSGSSYVVFGTAGGFSSTIDLTTLDGTNGFRLDGVGAYDISGISVASAGDVNGDGFDDVIVGARYADPNGTNSGSSYVVFGKAAGFVSSLSLSMLDGTTGFRLDGAAEFDRSGRPVASAGDVNGDGFDDIVVGSPYADPNGQHSGSSYVVFGRSPDTAVERTGSAVSQKIMGGAFDDTLSGLGGDDTLVGGDGGDQLTGGEGADSLLGGAGDDTVDGGPGDDTLRGGLGDDLMLGGHGNDEIWTDGGADTAYGDSGNDIFYLNERDYLIQGTYSEIDGGSGNDTLEIISRFNGITIDLVAGTVVWWDGAERIQHNMTAVENISAAGDYIGTHRFNGNDDANRLEGHAGTDFLAGRGGNDTLIGASGNDFLEGGSGHDLLEGGAGADEFVGGDGNDTASYASSSAGVTVDLGTGTGEGGHAAGDTLTGIENLIGSAFADRLTGDGDANRLLGGEGNDILLGASGHDVLRGGAGHDALIGGDGDDRLIGEGGADLVYGGPGSDALVGGDGDDRLLGQNGADLLYGGIGNDTLLGGDGDDRMLGQGGADLMYGGIGSDTLLGGDGDDQIVGEAGADLLYGHGGRDLLYGGMGKDTLVGGDGNDRLLGQADADIVYGGSGSDTLIGGDGDDRLLGQNGADLLYGGIGNDTLLGGDGDDVLVGGGGRDVLFGGAAADTFVFSAVADSPPGAERNIVNDFSAGEGDRVQLGAIDADSTTGGNQPFSFIGSAAFSGAAGELRFTTNGTHGFAEGDVDGDSAADFAITFFNLTTMDGGDFLL